MGSEIIFPANDDEAAAIRRLAEAMDVTDTVVLRQALRHYQRHHSLMMAGEACTYSGDAQRARDFAGTFPRSVKYEQTPGIWFFLGFNLFGEVVSLEEHDMREGGLIGKDRGLSLEETFLAHVNDRCGGRDAETEAKRWLSEFRKTFPPIEQRWYNLAEAPLGRTGVLFSPSSPDRNDILGSVFEYHDGERSGTSAHAHGCTFTKWHPLPEIPA